MKRVVITLCPHEGCGEEHRLDIGAFRVIRGPGGERKAKGFRVRIKPEDAEWARKVKERDGWTCRRCGNRPSAQGLHAHHVFKRRHLGTRHDVDNGLSLCFSCHVWAEAHDDEALVLAETILGTEKFLELAERKQAVRKRVKREVA